MTVSFARIGNSLKYAQKGGTTTAGPGGQQNANLNGTTTLDQSSKLNDATYTQDPGSLSNLNTFLVANGYTNAQVQVMTRNDMIMAARLTGVFANTAP